MLIFQSQLYFYNSKKRLLEQLHSSVHLIIVHLEEDQIVLIDAVKEKTLSYHGNLEHAVKKIAYLSIVSKEKDYTLTGFIESYKNIVERLTLKFKIWNVQLNP